MAGVDGNEYSFIIEEHIIRVKICVVVADSKEEAEKKAKDGEAVFEYIDPTGPGSMLMEREVIDQQDYR